MKTIRNSVLLLSASMSVLSGCSTIETSPLYASWKTQAYNAYGMQFTRLINPVYRRAAVSSPTGYVYMPEQGYISQPATESEPVSRDEQLYVASYYGLN